MKRIFNLLFFTIVFLCMSINVQAIDNTVTHNLRQLNSISLYKGATAAYFTETTSTGVLTSYCININKTGPNNNARLTLKGGLTDPGLVWIMANGEGGVWNSSLFGGANLSKDQKYYATQLAVWLYQGTLNKSVINATAPIGSTALKIAEYAKTRRVTAPKVSLSQAGTLKLSGDGRYYVSNTMQVGGLGYSTATVNLINVPATAEIVTTSNEVKKSGSTLNAGTRFYVRIPINSVNTNMKPRVRVTATGYNYKGYVYYVAGADRQDIGLVVREPISVTDETSLSVEAKGSLRITKVDVSSGSKVKLSNVTISVKNSSGVQIARWTTNSSNNPMVITNLPLGTYTIIEESAPAGYIKSSNVTVSVTAGKATEVELVNTKNPSKVRISKQDITTKAELPGAHLILKDALGNKIDEWTSTATPHYIQTLSPGTYTLTETIAPTGYLLSSETVTFTVDRDGGSVKNVVMYNSKIPDNSVIKISKKDITTGKELPGAKLVIKDGTGKIIEQWISTTKPHYVSNLKAGKYTLVETKPPKGYEIGDEIVEFEVTADGGVEKPVVMYNSKIPVTADMNISLIVAGLIGTVAIAGFSVFKLGQQQA